MSSLIVEDDAKVLGQAAGYSIPNTQIAAEGVRKHQRRLVLAPLGLEMMHNLTHLHKRHRAFTPPV